MCYELPQVAERLAMLALYEGRFLDVGQLLPGLEHGPFDAHSLAVMQAFAPTIVHAVRLHHTGNTLHQDLGDLMLARARAAAPTSPRATWTCCAACCKARPTRRWATPWA